MSILVVYWVDTVNERVPRKGPFAQVQAVAAVTIDIHQIRLLVVVEKNFSKLRICFLA